LTIVEEKIEIFSQLKENRKSGKPKNASKQISREKKYKNKNFTFPNLQNKWKYGKFYCLKIFTIFILNL